jgi:hypothetical protein
MELRSNAPAIIAGERHAARRCRISCYVGGSLSPGREESKDFLANFAM